MILASLGIQQHTVTAKQKKTMQKYFKMDNVCKLAIQNKYNSTFD